MLDETIDILTLLFCGKQFDYDGSHYRLRLTQVDEQYYPPPPVQQPRIPLWIVGVWPRKKSMRRVLKGDGWLPNKMNDQGQFEDILPEDVREVRAYNDANRTLDTPFDIVVEGKTGGMGPEQIQAKLSPWVEAGATWWIDGYWEATPQEVAERLRQGPPKIG